MGRVWAWLVGCVALVVVVMLPVSGAAGAPGASITAMFVQSEYATHYSVDVSGFSAPVKVTWTLTLTCIDLGCPNPTGTLVNPQPAVDSGCDNNGVGTQSPYVQTLASGATPEFVWHHPSASDDPTGTYHCDHAEEGGHGHQGLITVVVDDGTTQCTSTYKGTGSSTSTSTSDGTASMPSCVPSTGAGSTGGTGTTGGTGSGATPCNPVKIDVFKLAEAIVYDGAAGRTHYSGLGKHIRETVGIGEVVQYAIIVHNHGECPATNVKISDALPAEFEWRLGGDPNMGPGTLAYNDGAGHFVETVTGTPGASGGGTVITTTATLLPHATLRLYVTGTVKHGGRLDNTAIVMSDETPAQSSDTVTFNASAVLANASANANASGVSGSTANPPSKTVFSRPSATAAKSGSGSIGIANVYVAIQKVGSGCRWLKNSRQQFVSLAASANGVCYPPLWLKAKGRRHWSLRFRERLPSGKYELLVKVVTTAGVFDTTFSPQHHNLLDFTVR
jgi:uncharacterized repeat protein (TIGR01451 family)